MSEHPILFSSPMVRAILEGRKTQTRRAVNPQPGHKQVHDWNGKRLYDGEHRLWWWKDQWWDIDWEMQQGLLSYCPYGQPGDLLWVRETWWRYKSEELEMAGFVGGTMTRLPDNLGVHWMSNPGYDPQKYPIWEKKPSIHMPRWASRLTLRIKDVRVQRVQEITEEDAKAEGDKNPFDGHTHHDGTPIESSAVLRFKSLWDSINAKRGYSWESNPLVWAISFERER